MKIVSLVAENIKKLRAVEIIPKGNLVELKGKNGSGKTSVLDAISWAFEGLAKVQDKPIRFGANKGWIRIDLGEYVVERTFKNTEDGDVTHTLTVMSAEGAKFDSPQTLLNKLFGSLAFDPLAFARAVGKDQVAMLESMVKEFDFGKSRAEEEAAYNERTVVNRKSKDASLTHMSFKDVPVQEPEKVDVTALTNDMAEAAKTNALREKVIAAREKQVKEFESAYFGATEELSVCRAEQQNLADQIEKAQAAVENLKKQLDLEKQKEPILSGKVKVTAEVHEKSKLISVPDAVDIAMIKGQLDTATEKNALHEKWLKKKQAKEEQDRHDAKSKELTEKITAIQQARVNAVAHAGLPIQGLGFDETGVTLNGVPFSQASDAEQLRASIAIAIAANPTLKVIRVRDGSLLDDDGMAILAEMADKNDCQIWVEVVGTGGVGFELVDGSLKQ